MAVKILCSAKSSFPPTNPQGNLLVRDHIPLSRLLFSGSTSHARLTYASEPLAQGLSRMRARQSTRHGHPHRQCVQHGAPQTAQDRSGPSAMQSLSRREQPASANAILMLRCLFHALSWRHQGTTNPLPGLRCRDSNLSGPRSKS